LLTTSKVVVILFFCSLLLSDVGDVGGWGLYKRETTTTPQQLIEFSQQNVWRTLSDERRNIHNNTTRILVRILGLAITTYFHLSLLVVVYSCINYRWANQALD
jgi:hypothetical protein